VGAPKLAPDRRRVVTERIGEIAKNAQIVDRMDVAGDELRDSAHARAVGGVAGQQRRLGVGFVEIFDDRERLRKDLSILLERRDQPLRVHREIGRRGLVVAAQVNEGPLAWQAFEVQRDADAKRSRGAKEIVKLHGMRLCWRVGSRPRKSD